MPYSSDLPRQSLFSKLHESLTAVIASCLRDEEPVPLCSCRCDEVGRASTRGTEETLIPFSNLDRWLTRSKLELKYFQNPRLCTTVILHPGASIAQRTAPRRRELHEGHPARRIRLQPATETRERPVPLPSLLPRCPPRAAAFPAPAFLVLRPRTLCASSAPVLLAGSYSTSLSRGSSSCARHIALQIWVVLARSVCGVRNSILILTMAGSRAAAGCRGYEYHKFASPTLQLPHLLRLLGPSFTRAVPARALSLFSPIPRKMRSWSGPSFLLEPRWPMAFSSHQL
ncbi:hypothetical protein EDB89DRAFT_1390170 [Lactarius sanguifluus]|nr:hypothetical protein EDB89DRAFT_1390170 [Lactarius sanguifluus]